MHYFIIHSGCDYTTVKNLIDGWSADLHRFRCSVLTGTQSDWHDDARAKIRGAEKVIYVVGATSGASENIDWELAVALEENKEIYVYKLHGDYPLNKVLDGSRRKTSEHTGERDGEIVFSSGRQRFRITDDAEMISCLREDDDYISSHLESSCTDPTVALKQYEMFVETSEELVKRKQTVNSFYITLNSLIVSVILAAFTLSGEITILGSSLLPATVIACLASAVGGIVCYSWCSILQSYADLNGSKMKIISYIETHLAYNLYDTEWQLVSKKMGNKKYKSFSVKEKFIAKLFAALYGLLFVAGIVLAFL